VNLSIHLKGSTVKALHARWEDAFCKGDLRLVRRIGALLLLNQDWEVSRIAEFWGVVDQTIYHWITAWLLDRWDSLHYATSPGRPANLTPTQKKRLKQLISAGPEEAGYPTGCWSSKLIQDLIWREFHVLYDEHYLSELLHNLDFSYQKARFVADHLDPEKRQAWIEQKWPQIVHQAKAQGALLLFADEASFAQWGSLAYTWALIGQQPVIKTCGKRKAYKVFGLIDYFSGRLFYQGHTGRFTAESYCQFLASVLAQTHQPIILVHDGAKYHTAAKTRAFCEQHAERLTVEPLPAYSPDYNPIEHLWRNVRRCKTHNRYFPEFELLITSVEDGLVHLQQHPEEVKQLMGTYLDQMAELAKLPVAV
jgi:transposase